MARSARCGSRSEPAYFVVARRPKTCPLAPPQHVGARSGVQLLAPLAADRARNPPTSSSLADQKRVRSLLLSTSARDPVFNCSLRSLRIALARDPVFRWFRSLTSDGPA